MLDWSSMVFSAVVETELSSSTGAEVSALADSWSGLNEGAAVDAIMSGAIS